ncbi:M48 family metalloprotease [Natronolimnobius sp. AArcel1]|nr:M48 family metalloprotease [Natronolimnobius sp. AArcel1]
MVFSVVLLGVATLGFITAVWGVFVGLLVFFRVSLSNAMTIATVPMASVLLAIAVLEWRSPRTIERAGAETTVDSSEYPELEATVTRVAAILDVPTPTIVVSETPVPEALVVGFRPSSIRLVLSTGTLATLEQDELEAVVAHELAHVKNRDAMVMTVLSLPTVLASGLVYRWNETSRLDLTIATLLAIVGLAGMIITQAIISVCARTRELAADRAAANVRGTGAPLASALQALDQEIQNTPSTDLREVQSVSALSILPLESDESEPPLTHWEDGGIEPPLWSIREPLIQLRMRLFRTHPTTTERLERLVAMEQESAQPVTQKDVRSR